MNLIIGTQFIKEFFVSEQIVNDFCQLTTDLNPLHLDIEFASKSVFGKRIAPGMLVSSFIAAVIGNDFPGKGTIYLSQNLKFHLPIFLEDRISVRVKVISIMPNNWIKLNTQCANQKGEIVISGEATIIPPSKAL